MDNSAKEIGQRLRFWRLRRNLARKQFADMVGRSTSWLDKVEKGERGLLRLPMLERVAEVLGVDPSALTDGAIAARTIHSFDAMDVRVIRSALSRYPALSGSKRDVVTVRQIKRQALYLDYAWLSSHLTVVTQHLPKLMQDAQTAVLCVPEDESLETYRVLVTTYRLASSVLLKFGANDIAWLAADRAMQTALAACDTWSLARATRSVARAMTSSDQQPEAISTLIDMADRMRAEVSSKEETLLSLYGMLFLAAAITAAEQQDHDLALHMHEEAAATAERFAPHYEAHHTHFGATNVLIHRVAALVRLREAGRALEFAQTIPPSDVAALSAERRANFLLDLTEAHTASGNHRQAVRLLGEAERVAPDEVQCRPVAHDLMRSLLGNTSGETARLAGEMAVRAGVTA